jgi:hypothetical protein
MSSPKRRVSHYDENGKVYAGRIKFMCDVLNWVIFTLPQKVFGEVIDKYKEGNQAYTKIILNLPGF